MKITQKRAFSLLLSIILLIGSLAAFPVSAEGESVITAPAVIRFESSESEYTFIPEKSDYYNFKSDAVPAYVSTYVIEKGADSISMFSYIVDATPDADDENKLYYSDGSVYLKKDTEYKIYSFAETFSDDENDGSYIFIPHNITITDNAMSIQPEKIEYVYYTDHIFEGDRIFVSDTIIVYSNILPYGADIRKIEISVSDNGVFDVVSANVEPDSGDTTYADGITPVNAYTLKAIGKGTAIITLTDPESGISTDFELTVSGSKFEKLFLKLKGFITFIIEVFRMCIAW